MKTTIITAILAASAAFAGEVTRPNVPVKPKVAEPKLQCAQGAHQFNDGEGVFCVRTSPMTEKINGPYVGIHPNGTVSSQGQYVEGNREGHWTFFDQAGHKSAEIDFARDSFHGQRVLFFENGQRKLEETYVSGKREGVQKMFDEQGRVTTATKFADDRAVAAN